VIRSFGEQHAVLLSTHILPEVTLICQRVAIINQGRLLAIDTPASLQRASEQTSRVLLTASAPGDALQTELLSIPGVIAVTTRPVPGIEGMLNAECQTDTREGVEAAIARAVAGRWNLHRLERQQPTLENIFLRYVSQAPAEARAPA
jgi:ABC-2 type transport system ATP-binding protein